MSKMVSILMLGSCLPLAACGSNADSSPSIDESRATYESIATEYNVILNEQAERYEAAGGLTWEVYPDYCAEQAAFSEDRNDDYEQVEWAPEVVDEIDELISANAEVISYDLQCAAAPGTEEAQLPITEAGQVSYERAAEAANAVRSTLGLPLLES